MERRLLFRSVLAFGLATAWSIAPVAAQTTAALDRTVLPIPEPQHKSITTLDARNAKAPARFQVKAPQGALNVLLLSRR